MERVVEALKARYPLADQAEPRTRTAPGAADTKETTTTGRGQISMVFYLVYHAPPFDAPAERFSLHHRAHGVGQPHRSFPGLGSGPVDGAPFAPTADRAVHSRRGPAAAIKSKAGTPTMGGLLIVAATVLPTVFWADLADPYVLLAIFAMLGFAAIGFADDYSKVIGKRNLGLTGWSKILLQIMVSLMAGMALLLMTVDGIYSTQLIVPFFKSFHPQLVIHALLGQALPVGRWHFCRFCCSWCW